MSELWYAYLVRCSDNSLYCGTTNDILRRVKLHNMQTGAKYTAARTPVVLVYAEECQNQSAACVREYAIKRMTKAQKEKLAADYSTSSRT
jgi:putative endonuclease